MKPFDKILAVIAAANGLIFSAIVFLPRLLVWFLTRGQVAQTKWTDAGSIGVIGGADGPTAVFVAAGRGAWGDLGVVATGLTSAVCVILLLVRFVNRRRKAR